MKSICKLWTKIVTILKGKQIKMCDNKYLYRYRSFESDKEINRIKKTFENNELYFPSPENFNDPFDCKALFTFKGATMEDKKTFLYQYIKLNNQLNNRTMNDDEIKNEINVILSLKEYAQQQKFSELILNWSDFLKDEAKELGMLCLSEKKNDILMWSHYAGGHTGICLQFDREIIKREFHDYYKNTYKKDYPTLKDFNEFNNPKSLHEILLLMKSDHWDYEREWRVISLKNKRSFPDKMITGVILGCEMEDDKREFMIKILKSRKYKTKLYQASVNKDKYELDIEKISY